MNDKADEVTGGEVREMMQEIKQAIRHENRRRIIHETVEKITLMD